MRFDTGEPIGEFEVKSGKLVVSDPCYDRDTWCAGILENVKNGVWEAYAYVENYGKGGFGGDRVKKLVVFHRDHRHDLGLYPKRAKFEVGVDSGQAGFFDDASYPQGEREEGGYWNKDAFYDECCDATCGRNDEGEGYGIIAGAGAVSSSGWGDGGYRCDYYEKDGQIVAAEVEFIPDEDEEDTEDDMPECRECGTQTYDLFEGLCEECGEEDEPGEGVVQN